MTTIAWDGKNLAADSRMTKGARKGAFSKIYTHKKRFVFAAAGDAFAIHKIGEWVADGCKEDMPVFFEDYSFEGMVFDLKTKQKYHLALYKCAVEDVFALQRIPLVDNIWALGSGCEYAMAGMTMGLDAREAVALAAKLDPYTGGDIMVVTI